MNTFWAILIILLGILDTAIIGARIIFGSTQEQLVHGAAPIVLPLYAVLLVGWGWIVYLGVSAAKMRRPISWPRFLVLVVLAVLPLLF